MPIPEILEDAADVRKLEIMTRRMVNNVMAGEYHSAFKGQGMEFHEVREYNVGDDVRFLDWNVTARTGLPHVKRYIEQRELTVIFAVDVSASSVFGSEKRRKRSLAAIVTALLAFSAIRNNDRVGLMLFSDEVETFLPPKKGRQHGLRVIREVIREPEHRGTDIPAALQALNRLQKRKSIVFLISDFQQEDIRKSLAITSGTMLIDTGSRRVRDELGKRLKNRRDNVRRLLRSLSIDHIDLRTDQDFAAPLINFFNARIKRLGGGG